MLDGEAAAGRRHRLSNHRPVRRHGHRGLRAVALHLVQLAGPRFSRHGAHRDFEEAAAGSGRADPVSADGLLRRNVLDGGRRRPLAGAAREVRANVSALLPLLAAGAVAELPVRAAAIPRDLHGRLRLPVGQHPVLAEAPADAGRGRTVGVAAHQQQQQQRGSFAVIYNVNRTLKTRRTPPEVRPKDI